MAKINTEKSISANSNGIIISYGDANKHQYMKYETPTYVKKIQLEGTVKYQKIEEQIKLSLNKKICILKWYMALKLILMKRLQLCLNVIKSTLQ